MQKLSALMEQADLLIEAAQKRPEKLLDLSQGGSKWKSIHQRLIDLYIEESKKQLHCKKLKNTSNLLMKLVARDHLNTLVVNLYPGNEGYSLLLRGGNGIESETIKLPYEETDLLEYIDHEELPPILIDLLESAQANIFYSGCVIAEVRDYRRCLNDDYDTKYVLLKPTPHTLLCDINSLTNDGHRWTQEDKFALESQLLLHTNEPLCLDPSPVVFLVANRLHYEKSKLNTNMLKRSVKKFTQASINRKRKLSQCAAPKHLFLHDFISQKREKLKSNPPVNLKVGKSSVDMWKQRDTELAVPAVIEVDKYARALDKPKVSFDNTPVTVEEYTLETERSQGKVYLTKLTIQKRQTDDTYIGELYVDRDYMQNQHRGSVCRFPLGQKHNVDNYIKQFTEIFTEEGRRSVKITHQRPGQTPIVTYTQTVPSYTANQSTSSSSGSTTTTSNSTAGAGGPSASAGGAQALLTQAQNLAATIASGQTADGKRPQPPIKLSLQINPNTGGAAATLGSPPGQAANAQPSPVSGGHIQAGQLTGGQLTLNLPVQQLTGQRNRQLSVLGTLQRAAGQSPATTPTGQPQLPSYTQATGIPTSTVATTTVTSPSTKTPSTPSSRRTSAGDTLHVAKAIHQAPSVTIMDGVESVSSQQIAAPNINITNITGLPQNISLANLQSMGIANLPNLQGLQNVQVSLANVTGPGGLTVPVPLSMINSGGINPTGILVSSLPQTIQAGSSTTGSDTSTTNTTSGNLGTTLVTMVTAMPGSMTTTTTTTTSGSSTSQSGVLTSQNMLQLPINMTGNLAQLVTANLKGAQGQIRAGAPLSVLQVPQMQLLNAASFQGARASLVQQQAAGSGSKSGGLPTSTTVLTAQPLSQQLLTRTGGTQSLGTQQLLQLTQQPLTPQQQQQIAQLALQHKQQQQQQQQLQVQLQQAPTPLQRQTSKSKNRKRTTPTPPKSS